MTEKKTAVICEDDVTLAAILKHLLSKQGFSVQTAADGHEGLQLVRATQPDLLLLDLAMPRADGLEVLEGLKRLPGKRPYTVIVSANEAPEKSGQAVTLGAKEVWTKPFNPAELIGRIKALIKQGII